MLFCISVYKLIPLSEGRTYTVFESAEKYVVFDSNTLNLWTPFFQTGNPSHVLCSISARKKQNILFFFFTFIVCWILIRVVEMWEKFVYVYQLICDLFSCVNRRNSEKIFLFIFREILTHLKCFK
jgi:hypothetical protein